MDTVPRSRSPAHQRGESNVSPVAVGVIVWLSSELMFFSGLFAAYFTLRAATDRWPPDGVDLSTGRAAVATAVLVCSSGTMHLAVNAARAGHRRLSVQWLCVTLVLGMLFIGNQLFEYVGSSFSISSHAYGSMFFLMTGFHGLHVIGGLVFMGGAIWLVSGRTSRAPLLQSIEMCGYYWHFVDVVWVFMFATLYLLR